MRTHRHRDDGQLGRGAVTSTIVFDERFGDACLQGLDEFSHVEVLFLLDKTTERSAYSPVVDLKPTMTEFLPTDARQPAWVVG
ncbi:MAG TPA: hypothetical protein VFR23_17340 [Jiangellaceae bacterium]|nr:hypothetical protein [Jiangellaceae bacterium]